MHRRGAGEESILQNALRRCVSSGLSLRDGRLSKQASSGDAQLRRCDVMRWQPEGGGDGMCKTRRGEAMRKKVGGTAGGRGRDAVYVGRLLGM